MTLPKLFAFIQLFTISSISWTLASSCIGSCGIILALFLSSNQIVLSSSYLCILLNVGGGALLTAASAGNAVNDSEFIPFVVLNTVFALVAVAALVRKTLLKQDTDNKEDKNIQLEIL